jgi:hypothetical protein
MPAGIWADWRKKARTPLDAEKARTGVFFGRGKAARRAKAITPLRAFLRVGLFMGKRIWCSVEENFSEPESSLTALGSGPWRHRVGVPVIQVTVQRASPPRKGAASPVVRARSRGGE